MKFNASNALTISVILSTYNRPDVLNMVLSAQVHSVGLGALVRVILGTNLATRPRVFYQ